MELEAKSCWLRYASHSKDKAFRQKKWNIKYENERTVFWDHTNIDFMFKPSTEVTQVIILTTLQRAGCFFSPADGWEQRNYGQVL